MYQTELVDTLAIETRARALRAAYFRSLLTGIAARFRPAAQAANA